MKTKFHSLTDICILTVCGGLVLAVLLPRIAADRSLARASGCVANLYQLGLAIHNYHAAYNQLPPGCGGTVSGETIADSNQGRLSPFVAILPFVEQQALWERISNPYTRVSTGKTFPPMGPAPWYAPSEYEPWSQSPSIYRCPEQTSLDVGKQREWAANVVYGWDSPGGTGLMTNYVVSYGDSAVLAGESFDPKSKESTTKALAANRGIFQANRKLAFRDILDGLSHTVMISETISSVTGGPGVSGIAKNVTGLSMQPSKCLEAVKLPSTEWHTVGRGSIWCDGALPITGFQTVLPPNSASCSSEVGMLDAIVSASSHHPDGVHVLMADGLVVFVSNTIDTGNLDSPAVGIGEGYTPPGSKSPYGVWGALGSRASAETVSVNDSGIEVVPRENRVTGSTNRDDDRNSRPFMTWRDRTGRQSLTARLLRIIDSKTVELQDTAGVLHQIPLNTLRDQDIYHAVEMDVSGQ